MNDTDRQVRAATYELMVERVTPSPSTLAERTEVAEATVAASLRRLHDSHRLVIDRSGTVLMAHPFSSFDTGHHALIGAATYHGNCAWDALAILGLLGDGSTRMRSASGGEPIGLDVQAGVVSPDAIVHFVVPPRRFWEDVAFT